MTDKHWIATSIAGLILLLAILAACFVRTSDGTPVTTATQNTTSQRSESSDTYNVKRPVRETHTKDVTYTVMTPVREQRTRTISYTVMTVVREDRTKIDPITGDEITYTVARHVPEQREKTIQYVVKNMVPVQHQKTVEYQTVRFETTQVSR
ncbi:hypothetical protein Q31b_50230 [Novipirellula aureliae]|uniref:Uncharacterized protein n=1 Tax=Novipirellula aureliae TaxID=2527966 RepID=A0A5C6DM67_9BACT|nr:hypothetical protein [Novipirellula aureliae]TWU36741.1 hypothetical protein Q31b_50230 [Novipirellula aureliae]